MAQTELPEIKLPERLQNRTSTAPIVSAPGRVQDATRAPARPALPAPLAADQTLRVDLGEWTGALPEPDGSGSMQIGVARTSAQTASAQKLAEQLQWSREPDGTWRTALRIRSGGAFGLRLGVEIEKLPPAAVLRTYAPGQHEKANETSGQHILQLLQANLDAGDTSANGRTWWAPDSGAEEAVLEIDLPPDTNPDMLRFSIPRVSHVAVNLSLLPAGGTQSKLGQIGLANSCHENVVCDNTTAKQATAEAVARINYVNSAAEGRLCTGTLLDNTSGDKTPYFLTANHCISTQAEAASSDTYWFFHAASCGASTTVQGNWVKKTGGAQLLYTRKDNDSTLLRLNYDPPTGAKFAQWNSATWAMGADAVSIHHPRGDLKKIGTAQTTGHVQCWNNDDNTFSCIPGIPMGNHVRADFSGPRSEPGSSGSSLLDTSGAVMGVLHGGGGNTCGGGYSYYGRFDQFFPLVKQWLDPANSAAALELKTDDGPNPANPVTADAAGTYAVAVQVANKGNASMTGIAYEAWTQSITSAPPLNCTWTLSTGGAGTCTVNAATNEISGIPAALAAGSSVTYTLNYTVSGSEPEHMLFHSIFASDQLGQMVINHMAAHTSTPTGAFTITLSGSGNSGNPLAPDATGKFSIPVNVKNTGTAAMSGISHKVSGIPTGATAIGCTPGCTVNTGTGVISGLPTALGVNANHSYTLHYTVPNPSIAHQLVHTLAATNAVTKSATSYLSFYNQSSLFNITAPGANSASPVLPDTNGEFSVQVTVQNPGGNTINGVSYQSGGIPATATAVSCAFSGGTCTVAANGTISNLPATISAGSAVSYTLKYTVPSGTGAHQLKHKANFTGGFDVEATSHMAAYSPTSGVFNITASGPTSANPVTPDGNGNVSLSVKVENSDAVTMNGVTYKATGFPATASAKTCTVSGGGTCTVANDGTISGNLPATLPANGSVSYTLGYTLTATTAQHQIDHAFTATGVSNAAAKSHVAAYTQGGGGGGSSAFDVTVPGPSGSPPVAVAAGGVVSLAVTVKNTSTSPLNTVTYKASGIPAAASDKTCTISGGGTCTIANDGTINNLPGTLVANGSVSYTLGYTVPNPQAAHQVTHAFAAAGGHNKSAISYITAYAQAGAFSITAPATATPDANGDVSVQVQVSNTGTAQMTGITYQSSGIPTSIAPASIGCAFIAASGPGVCTVAADGTISGIPGTLAVGANVSYTLTYTVPDPTPAHVLAHSYAATGGISGSGRTTVLAFGQRSRTDGLQSVPATGALALGGTAALMALLPGFVARRRRKAAAANASVLNDAA